jgi:DNA (cytosine-5)-methyltransferase 1
MNRSPGTLSPRKIRRLHGRVRGRIKVAAIDLFCGAGGLTNGLQKAGVDVRLGVDVDPACEYPYTKNNRAKFALKSIDDISAEKLTRVFGKSKYTLLAGCAPCQPFSKYSLGKGDEEDGRWHLLKQFQRLVLEVKPVLVTMENVPRLADQEIFWEFEAALEENDYFVTSTLIKCADYGVAQQRERLVLLASRLGPISFIPPTHAKKHRTVRDVIGKLPRLAAGKVHSADELHQASRLSPLNLTRIKASRPGGTWRDWSKDIVAACHRKKTGKKFPSVYGRMCWDEPAPTVTTQFFGFGNGRFGHPSQNRAISLREGAMIQSFSKQYSFTKPGEVICRKSVGRLIGNAVPVRLGVAIGKTIIRHVQEHA